MTTKKQRLEAAQQLFTEYTTGRTKDIAEYAFGKGAEWAELQMRWIPVTESLPEGNRACLFVVDLPGSWDHQRVYGGYYTGDPTSEYHKNRFSTPVWGVAASHWMYSPEPPPPRKWRRKTLC